MAEHTNDQHSSIRGRRSLLLSLVALPFVATSVSWLRGAKTTSPRARSGNALDWQLTVADAKNRGQVLLASYPRPKWLPADFRIQSTTACSADRSQRGAFVGVEDSQQLCFSATRQSTRSHGEFINSALNIFVAPLGTMPEVRGKASEITPLTISVDGETVEARYYNSHHDREAFGAAHCLAFHRNGFGVVVSSFHKNRLTRADLERVAVSVL